MNENRHRNQIGVTESTLLLVGFIGLIFTAACLAVLCF